MHEKSIDYLSLFPKRGDHNAIWTEKKNKNKHSNKEQGNTKYEAPRSKKIEATQNDNNTGNALQRSVA